MPGVPSKEMQADGHVGWMYVYRYLHHPVRVCITYSICLSGLVFIKDVIWQAGKCVKEDAMPVHQTLLKDKCTLTMGFYWWSGMWGHRSWANGEGRPVLHWMTAISLLEWEGTGEVSLWETPQEWGVCSVMEARPGKSWHFSFLLFLELPSQVFAGQVEVLAHTQCHFQEKGRSVPSRKFLWTCQMHVPRPHPAIRQSWARARPFL